MLTQARKESEKAIKVKSLAPLFPAASFIVCRVFV